MTYRVLTIAAAVTLTACTPAKPVFDPDGAVVRDAAFDAGPRDAGGGCADASLSFWSDDQSCGTCGNDCADRRCIAAECSQPVISQVAMADDTVCTLLTSGRVICWGGNQEGQLGRPGEDETFTRPDPVAIDLEDVQLIRSSSGASPTFCALLGSGEVWCWGHASSKYGPVGFIDEFNATPRRLEGATVPILDVAVGSAHICVRTATTVLCSGRGLHGQLGRPENPDIRLRSQLITIPMLPTPMLPTGAAPVSVAVNNGISGFTLIAFDDGRVFALGGNSEGECGILPHTQVNVPTEIPTLSNIVEVYAGFATACARDTAGAIYCWGNNDSGQTGNGMIGGPPQAPAQVMGALSGVAVAGLALQLRHVLAVGASGEGVFGWGQGDNGQFGRGPTFLDDVPAPIALFSRSATSYRPAVGLGAACVMETSGGDVSLLCAGSNGSGQMGHTDSGTQPTFEPVPYFE